MRQEVMAVVLALALAGPSAASTSEPPATQENAQWPGDLRVLAIERRPGREPVAVIALRGGSMVTLGVGDSLGKAIVTSISLEEAMLQARLFIDDPNQIKQWRDVAISQWSSVPLASMGVADVTRCPTALLRVEDDVAVFGLGGRDGTVDAVRLRAGAQLCGDWRIDCVDPGAEGPVDYGLAWHDHGVVILRDASTGRRIALASWRP